MESSSSAFHFPDNIILWWWLAPPLLMSTWLLLRPPPSVTARYEIVPVARGIGFSCYCSSSLRLQPSTATSWSLILVSRLDVLLMQVSFY
ncbi:hypothetical protein L2E82_04313 [Cichorium intybus]|uniref:Uncharacterized protein n=1 Tax=Cichorium intybus TaxID=13427 RepID=A0ACB9H4X9_CICIN|nr:hypothetical protein L2E82_04313 [Cichorium intybus]